MAAVKIALLAAMVAASAEDEELRKEASDALRKAVEYFRTEAADHGGYLWRYSEDLGLREGEGKAEPGTVWVQPPGTPSIGDAYLKAYRATGDDYYLDAAVETAMALVRGQLRSGGWDYRIEFNPEQRARYAYRVDSPGSGQRNVSTLDDETTQAALGFLMRLDQALNFKNVEIRSSVDYALSALLETQYPNGAWPQRFDSPPNPDDYPVRKASFPKEWSRTHPKEDYRDYYTFNDNSISDMIATMLLAAEIYDKPEYRASAIKGGDFILLAQLPDPQPAWAQQYDINMHPAWARRFEPPAVTGGESQGILRTLINLYQKTGEERFLEPVPKAIAYLQKSRLPNGQLARFYEMETNRPLYFTREYELVYHDRDLPTHYAFKVADRTDQIQAQYERAKAESNRRQSERRPRRASGSLISRTRETIAALDSKGRWLEKGSLRYQDSPADGRIIDCRTFVRNVGVLTEFLESAPAGD